MSCSVYVGASVLQRCRCDPKGIDDPAKNLHLIAQHRSCGGRTLVRAAEPNDYSTVAQLRGPDLNLLTRAAPPSRPFSPGLIVSVDALERYELTMLEQQRGTSARQ